MSHTAVVTFTARPLQWILEDGGSRDWRLDPQRAAKAEFLVCTQNRHNTGFGAPTAPHGAAFLIGRVSAVVPSSQDSRRWLIKFDEYTVPSEPIQNIWGKLGHQRYPICYTTLEELGIDLATLPPFRPTPSQTPSAGLSDVSSLPLVPPLDTASYPRRQQRRDADQDANARLDAILAQLDRIPDLPAPKNPLAWDEHGLPQ